MDKKETFNNFIFEYYGAAGNVQSGDNNSLGGYMSPIFKYKLISMYSVNNATKNVNTLSQNSISDLLKNKKIFKIGDLVSGECIKKHKKNIKNIKGIITHIQKNTQNIPIYLHVLNDEDKKVYLLNPYNSTKISKEFKGFYKTASKLDKDTYTNNEGE